MGQQDSVLVHAVSAVIGALDAGFHINPDGGGNLLGLLCMFVHFPVWIIATDYQLTDSQQTIGALIIYPFIWAGFWFFAVWIFKRLRKNKRIT